jgi:uncharacterized protein (TIGR03435 family)
VTALEGELNAPVTDETGLTGYYDFNFEFLSVTGVSPNSTPTPALSTLLQEVGLKLEKALAPTEVFIVDHVDKRPTEN